MSLLALTGDEMVLDNWQRGMLAEESGRENATITYRTPAAIEATTLSHFRTLLTDLAAPRLERVASAAKVLSTDFAPKANSIKWYVNKLLAAPRDRPLLGPGPGSLKKKGAVRRATCVQPDVAFHIMTCGDALRAAARVAVLHAPPPPPTAEPSARPVTPPAETRAFAAAIDDANCRAADAEHRMADAERRAEGADQRATKAERRADAAARHVAATVEATVKAREAALAAREAALARRLETIVNDAWEEALRRARLQAASELEATRAAATALAIEKFSAEAGERKAKRGRADALTASTELAVKLDRATRAGGAAGGAAAADGAGDAGDVGDAGEKPWLPGRDSTRGEPFDVKTRLLIYKLLTLFVPPEQIPEVIAAVISAVFENEKKDFLKRMELPSRGFCAKLRWELAGLNDVVAANELALADRVGTGGTDGTPADGLSFDGHAVQLVPKGRADRTDMVLGVVHAPKGSAVAEAKRQKVKIYDRLHAAFAAFRSALEKGGVDDSGLGSADKVGIHRLAGAVLQSDNASKAIASNRELAKLVATAVEEEIGPELWGEMDDEARAEAVRVFLGTCEKHLYNTYLGGAMEAQTKALEMHFGEELRGISFVDRATLDMDKLARSIAKALGTGRDLYGKTIVVSDWLHVIKDLRSKDIYVPAFVRTERGARQDAQTEVGAIIYYLRPYILKALKPALDRGAEHLLRRHIYGELSSNCVVAAFASRAVLEFKLTRYMRFLVASKSVGWSCVDATKIHQAVLAACQIAPARYAETWLNADWHPFGELAKEVPEFMAHVKLLSDDEDTATLEAEVFNPQDATNAAARGVAVVLLEAMLKGIRAKILAGQGARRVGDGDLANADAATAAAFKGSWATTCVLERIHAVVKAYLHRFNNLGVTPATAVAVACDNGLLPLVAAKFQKQRKSSRKKGAKKKSTHRSKPRSAARVGLLEAKFTPAQREVLVAHVRRDVPRRKKQESDDLAEVLEAERAAGAEADAAAVKRSAKALVAAVDAFTTVPVVPDSELATTSDVAIVKAVDDALKGKSGNQSHDFLKLQLERIVKGQGHGKLKPASYTSSKKAEIGARGTTTNVAYLRHALVSALTLQKKEALSLTAASSEPTGRSASVFTIGAATAQRTALDALVVHEKDLVLDEAMRLRDARKTAAEEVRAAAAARRRPVPPPITSALEERRVEVCVRWFDGTLFWCKGVIGDVSDAETRHVSGRKVGMNRLWVHFDPFHESYKCEDLPPTWLDVSRVTYFMADDKEGAWRFIDDDDDAAGDDDDAAAVCDDAAMDLVSDSDADDSDGDSGGVGDDGNSDTEEDDD